MTVFQPHDFPTIALLIGIHSSGKSTFYHQYLYESHIRICSKQLKTRYREQLLLDACLCGKVPFAVDSTNITQSIRAPLIYRGKKAGFKIVAYFFNITAEEAYERRQLNQRYEMCSKRDLTILASKLETPDYGEGFDHIYSVTSDNQGGFLVQTWTDQPLNNDSSSAGQNKMLYDGHLHTLLFQHNKGLS